MRRATAAAPNTLGPDPSEALVLSGGGTKGAFEVGAVQYLARTHSYLPGIITGTSAGALIAGPLAQAQNGEDLHHLVGVVRRNALSITDISSVFGEQAWLSQISGTPLGDLIHELISVRSRPEVPEDSRLAVDPLRIPHPRRRHRTLYAMSTAVANSTKIVKASRQLLANSNAIMNLDPLEHGYRGLTDVGVARVHESAVSRSGISLRLCMASMRSGRPRYVTETGAVAEEDGFTIRTPAGTPGVIEGMLASSSVPMMFPPRQIGDDIYCDGGIIQNTPLEVAVRIGAKNVTTILATPLQIPHDDNDFTQASMASVYARAASTIGPNETQRANLRYPIPEDGSMTLIAPTVDVLGGFEVEAGLIEIDFDYGWLRAAEATTPMDEHDRAHLQQLSDQIASQRERAWFLEERILQTGHRLHLAGALRHARALTAVACQEWLASGLEPCAGMELWGYEWEQHRMEIPTPLESVGRVG